MWAILNAPLLIACQMNVIDDFTVKLLVNPVVGRAQNIMAALATRV